MKVQSSTSTPTGGTAPSTNAPSWSLKDFKKTALYDASKVACMQLLIVGGTNVVLFHQLYLANPQMVGLIYAGMFTALTGLSYMEIKCLAAPVLSAMLLFAVITGGESLLAFGSFQTKAKNEAIINQTDTVQVEFNHLKSQIEQVSTAFNDYQASISADKYENTQRCVSYTDSNNNSSRVENLIGDIDNTLKSYNRQLGVNMPIAIPYDINDIRPIQCYRTLVVNDINVLNGYITTYNDLKPQLNEKALALEQAKKGVGFKTDFDWKDFLKEYGLRLLIGIFIVWQLKKILLANTIRVFARKDLLERETFFLKDLPSKYFIKENGVPLTFSLWGKDYYLAQIDDLDIVEALNHPQQGLKSNHFISLDNTVMLDTLLEEDLIPRHYTHTETHLYGFRRDFVNNFLTYSPNFR